MLKVSHVSRLYHHGNLFLHYNFTNILTFIFFIFLSLRREIHRAISQLCTRLLTGGERQGHTSRLLVLNHIFEQT